MTTKPITWSKLFSEGSLWDRAFATTCSMDRRSVALFRILLGLVVIYDLVDRAHDLRAHYTDYGAFPRYMAIGSYSHVNQYCIHCINGTTTFAALVFLIHGLIASLLVVGYRSRTMAFLNWVFILSLIARNSPITHGGDNYLKMISFIAIFLPIGSCFSLDALLRPDYQFGNKRPSRQQSQSPYSFYSPATVSYALQLTFVYGMGFFLKSGPDWQLDHTATYYAFSLSYFRRPLADFLWQFTGLLKFLTISVLWWEGVGVLLFFAPVFHGPVRTLACLGFTFLHVGFGSCMRLDTFIYTGMSAPLALLPSWFWDYLLFPFLYKQTSFASTAQYRRSALSSATSSSAFSPFHHKGALHIYYNPNLPHLHFLAKCADTYLFFPDTLEVHSIDQLSGSDSTPTSNTWVVIDLEGHQQTGFTAFLEICKASPVLFWFAGFLRSAFVRSWLNKAYLRLQRRFSSSSSSEDQYQSRLKKKGNGDSGVSDCFCFGNNGDSSYYHNNNSGRKRGFFRKTGRRLGTGIMAFTAVFLICWNVATLVPQLNQYRLYWNWIREYGLFMQLGQGWAMFAPHPPHAEFYYVIAGELEGGEQVELWKNEGVFKWEKHLLDNSSYDPPEPFYKPFYNHRWFKYYESLNRGAENQETHPLRLAFGRYICREWNTRYKNESRLHTFTIYYMWREWFLNSTYSQPHQDIIWGHMCYEKPNNTNATTDDSSSSYDDSSYDDEEYEKGRKRGRRGGKVNDDSDSSDLDDEYSDYYEDGYEGYEDLLEDKEKDSGKTDPKSVARGEDTPPGQKEQEQQNLSKVEPSAAG